MARKSPAAPAPEPAKAKRKPRAKATRRPPAQKALGTPQFVMPPGASYADMSRMANMLTPEQAIELYKANARMALDVINAAIESTAKLRRLQYQGEEQARELHRKAAKSASEAKDPHSLMAVGQGAAQEALEKSMHYWGEMFDLITEIQKRVFTLIEDQASGMPGVKQAKAAMAALPDLKPMQNVVEAMKGVMGAGGNAFEQMQKVMADFSRMAQPPKSGGRR
ncbi:MAG: phasin family protein [Betaproteobacteria bacterium]|jgi:phasin family protein|nr:phasin family protein [Betaproteobacteria bacterium]